MDSSATSANIAAILQRGGDLSAQSLNDLAAIRAHAATSQASIWSNFATNLATIADPARLLKEVNDAKTQKLQQTALGLTVQEQQQTLKDKQALGEAYGAAYGAPHASAPASPAPTPAVDPSLAGAPSGPQALAGVPMGAAGPASAAPAPNGPPAPPSAAPAAPLTEDDYAARSKAGLDTIVAHLSKTAPDLIPGTMAAWTKSNEDAADLRKKLADAGKAKDDAITAHLGLLGNLAQSVLDTTKGDPAIVPQAIQIAAANYKLNGFDPAPLLAQLQGKSPEQQVAALQAIAAQQSADALQKRAQAAQETAAAATSAAALPGVTADAAQKVKVNAGTSATGITAEQQATLDEQKARDKAEADSRAFTQHQQTLDTQLRERELALNQKKADFAESQGAANTGYQAESKRLDALRKPIDDAQGKIAELTDLVNKGTPEADALIAPKLLTVLVGGQGSGVRINQAEINNVVGGRTNAEGLLASLNKWSLDPAHAQIPAAQRQQIRALIATVADKAATQTKLIQDADAALLDAKTPVDQRTVGVTLRKNLESVNAGLPYVGETRSQNGETRTWDGTAWQK